MGDSEDEYHRRGRDKFARERNDYSDRGRQRDYDFDRRGDNHQYSNGTSLKRSSSTRRDDYISGNKRSRIDSSSDSYDPVIRPTSEESPPRVMMTFKKFLATQDDNITDEDAIAKYSEYKMDFKRQELQKFFDAHKDEEWFRLKYHPDDSSSRKEEQHKNLLRRLEIFEEMQNKGIIDKIRIDFDCAADIIRVMDTLVVKLEGGTDEDVNMLQNEKIDDESVVELEKEKRFSNLIHVEEKKESGGETDEGKKNLEESANGDGAVSDSDGERKEDDENNDEHKGERQKKKMLLHKTSSIFLRNVAPSITMQEIEAVCMRFPGFLRVGMADPLPDRKFFRRGWVTFRRDVNIKEICWNLNNFRIRDCDLGAIVNRDLARRVRSVNGITGHKQVAQNDLRLAAKLVTVFDKKTNIYQPEKDEDENNAFEMDPVAKSRNPLLKNITDFLIEEANAEEEELLGLSAAAESDEDQKTRFQRDDALLKKLDKIILYLRVVHSVDFYNHGEYPNEDVMPNRCGMMHVRAAPPSPSQWGTDENGKTLVSQKFVNDFIAQFTSHIKNALLSEVVLTEADLENLGQKDPEKEVEAFIQANSVELAKDKWLCPLSGKKFKGPEFIRKHLTSKHQEKLDQVRQEAVFFNNYLSDPKRPQPAEVKPQSVVPTTSIQRDDRRERDTFEERRFSGRSGGYSDRNRGYSSGGRYGGSYGNRGYDSRAPPRYYEQPSSRREPREPISYKDLDAPEDVF
uniref:Serrate RNA effector molecule homolog n=1 Tax=Syphacia muris TaxID=451379 RepID=A0A158R582_9BILA